MISLPRIKIAQLPTPIEPLPRLSKLLAGPKIFIKRDDQTGLAFGGNKTRKLELLLAEAQISGSRTLITAGAVQSNHCRQTAAAAARFGFECILILTGEMPAVESGNLLLDHLFGAELVFTRREHRDQTLQEVFDSTYKDGRMPYLIPYGGSSPIGAAGYVLAIQEMMEQDSDFDWIVIPSSSGGTQAGMVLGGQLSGFRGQILGISIDEDENVLKQRVADLATNTARTIGEQTNISASNVQVNADYLGEGYGVMGNPEVEAINLFARYEGLLLDPVYTGRAAAGLIDLIRQGFFAKDSNVLFWHTGGTPALFADRYKGLILEHSRK